MTGPNPSAVGTYGPDIVEFAANRGIHMRWWQRLVLYRLAEHDDNGDLVWIDAFISTARQVGKSFALRELALWRVNSGNTFDAEQLVLHTGKDLASCREIMRRARPWARDMPGWYAREGNGNEEIGYGDGSRWLIRASTGVYSYSATLGIVDEAWGVPPGVVDEGIEPTIAEARSGQLVLFSTAHRLCTPLVPPRRAGLLNAMAAGEVGASLMLEWSAPRGSEMQDRDAWRLASPHWTPARARLLESKLRRAQSGELADPDEHDDPLEAFKSQWLNIWPSRRVVASNEARPLVDRDTWADLADLYAAAPDGVPLVLAVNDYLGLRAAAAACTQLPDGRLLVWGGVFDSPGDAYAWCAFTIGRRDYCRVLVGRSLSVTDARASLPESTTVEKVPPGFANIALPLSRSLIRAGRVVHSGDEALATQITGVGLVPTIAGGLSQAHRGIRADLLHSATWAIAERAEPVEQPLPFAVY